MKKITDFLIVLCLFLVILVGIFFKLYLNSYKVFNEVQLVATVECKKIEKKLPALEIELYLDKTHAKKEVFPFKADEWVIEGRIIKWKGFLSLLGLKSYYHLERISGRYFDIEKEKTMPRIAYSLMEKPDKLWFFVYKYQKLFPIIDAVYGSSAFVPFAPGKRFQIFITNTGFMLRDATPPQKRSWWQVG